MRRAWILVFGAVAAVGCQKVWGFEEFEEGNGALGGGGGTGATGTGATGGVSGSGGASGASGGVAGGGTGGSAGSACDFTGAPGDMAGVVLPSQKCILMDRSEVSTQDYLAFTAALTAQNIAPYQIPPCQWKAAPGDFAPGCGTDAGIDNALPMTCVDWCDARAYCLSESKVLCGDQVGDPDAWWETACAAGGNAYPYGQTYDPNICNGGENTAHGCVSGDCKLVASGTSPGCVTASGLQDLSGNAAEWVDNCNGYTDEQDQCDVRGGSVADTASGLACNTIATQKRDARNQFRGFRCCKTWP